MPIVNQPSGLLVADSQPKLELKLLSPTALVPLRSTTEAAGFDIHAFLLDRNGRASKLMLPTKTTRAVPTGLALKPPAGHVALVCSRSGMAKERSLFVANSPGVIDPDYTGELLILLYNGGHEAQYIEHGQRIAQIVVLALPSIGIQIVDSLPQTGRGSAGFGSTGV